MVKRGLLGLLACIFFLFGVSANVLQNPSFEKLDLNDWSGSGIGNFVRVAGGLDGEGFARITTNSQTSYNVYQRVQLDEMSNSPVYASYYLRINEFEEGKVINNKITVRDSEGNSEYSWNYMRPVSDTGGEWVFFEHSIYPEMEYDDIEFLTYTNYGGGGLTEVDLDAANLMVVDDVQFYSFDTHLASLRISSLGDVVSLSDGETDYLTEIRPLSSIYYQDGVIARSSGFFNQGGDLYRVSYNYGGDVVAEALIRVDSFANYISFEITEFNDYRGVLPKYFQLFHLSTNRKAHDDRLWAENADFSELFIDSLALTVDTFCPYGGDAVFREFGTGHYRCLSSGFLEVGNAKGAIVITDKENYFSDVRDVLNKTIAQDVIMRDGLWAYDSPMARDMYLFVDVDHESYLDVAEMLADGRFDILSILNAVDMTFYNDSHNYEDEELFYSDVREIGRIYEEENSEGVKMGVHTYPGVVEYGDSGFSKEVIFKRPVGNLVSVDRPSGEVCVDAGLGDNLLVNYNPANGVGKMYFFDDFGTLEFFKCSSYVGNCLRSCTFGVLGTGSSISALGTPVYITHYRWDEDKLFLADDSIREEYFAPLAEFADKINGEYFFFDGMELPAHHYYYVGDWNIAENLVVKYMVLPYLEEYVDLFGYWPVFEASSDFTSFTVPFNTRAVIGDGPTFKNKYSLMNDKVGRLLSFNPYHKLRPNFGWWRMAGGSYSTGIYDVRATSEDDVHYLMSKVIGYNTTVGVQLMKDEYYQELEGYGAEEEGYLDELFGIIGTYQVLKAKQLSGGVVVPQEVYDYLLDRHNEAELNSIGNQFIQKDVFEFYFDEDSAGEEFTFENRFGEQGLNLEVYPLFDYYGFGYSGNYEIEGFDSVSGLSVRPSSSNVVCSLTPVDDGVRLDVQNDGGVIGGCEISLGNVPAGALKNKRGLGLNVTSVGEPAGEEVRMRLQSNYFGLRDFVFDLDEDFEDGVPKEVIVGEAEGYVGEKVDGTRVDWTKVSHFHEGNWRFGYGADLRSYVYLNRVLPGKSSSVVFHGMEGLAEVGDSEVRNVNLTLNGFGVILQVNLSVNDSEAYLLRLGGDSYELLTPNYELVDSGSLERLEVLGGENGIAFESNDSFSQRVMLKVSVYDDEDGDGVPTNGSFGSGKVCSSGDYFCDDNCLDVYNPSQADSDGDGVGDACESGRNPESEDDNDDNGGNNNNGGDEVPGGDDLASLGGCVELWSCGNWGECLEGVRIRECYDIHGCGTTGKLPVMEDECGGFDLGVSGDNQPEEGGRLDIIFAIVVLTIGGLALIGFFVARFFLKPKRSDQTIHPKPSGLPSGVQGSP